MNSARGSIRSGTMTGPQFAVSLLSDDAKKLQRGAVLSEKVVGCEIEAGCAIFRHDFRRLEAMGDFAE